MRLLLTGLAFGLASCSSGQPYAYQQTPPTTTLPPSTVRLEATVESCSAEGEQAYRCRLRAHRVIAYGSGGRVTPPETSFEATFAHAPLGIERSPETGARIDALVESQLSIGPEPTHRVIRLYEYTSPR